MRSHIFVHRATTKYFSNSFVFKTKIEKEGLPGDITPALGAGGPEFESRRPDQSMFFVSHHFETTAFLPPVVDKLACGRNTHGLEEAFHLLATP